MDARNLEYLFYGFLAIWAIIATYVVTLIARERRLKRELDQVKATLAGRRNT